MDIKYYRRSNTIVCFNYSFFCIYKLEEYDYLDFDFILEIWNCLGSVLLLILYFEDMK